MFERCCARRNAQLTLVRTCARLRFVTPNEQHARSQVGSTSVPDEAKIEQKSTKNRRKSMKKRCNFGLGRSWALKAIRGTRQDALKKGPGRQKAALGSILRRPGQAKCAREPSPGPVTRQSWTSPECRPSAFGALSIVEHARETIFRRFCIVAQKLQCASCINFYNVLY